MKRIVVTVVATSLLIISASFAAGCGTTGASPATLDFQVLVTDGAGNPLAGAKVVSNEQPQGQLKVTGMTDAAGKVNFKGIAPGDYTFYVSRFDYNQVDFAITLTPTNNSLTIKMTPSVTPTPSPTASPTAVTFDQLVTDANKYSGNFVTVEGYFFAGFEISALASALAPATYAPENVAPVQPLIWVEGNLGQSVYDGLKQQSNTPSGYPERFGKVRVTGQFQTGEKYGHLNAYNYKLSVISAALLP